MEKGSAEYQRKLVAEAQAGSAEAKAELKQENWAENEYELTDELVRYIYDDVCFEYDGSSWPDKYADAVADLADRTHDQKLIYDYILRSGSMDQSWRIPYHRLWLYKAVLWGCEPAAFLYGSCVDAAHLKREDTKIMKLMHDEYVKGNEIAIAMLADWSEKDLKRAWDKERGVEPEPEEEPTAEVAEETKEEGPVRTYRMEEYKRPNVTLWMVMCLLAIAIIVGIVWYFK